jgi:predicted dehydrogenase
MANPTVQRKRTGVVGCGKVAATHASAWHRLAASELVGVCDRNLDRAKALASQFEVRAYADLAEMIEAERVEVLSIGYDLRNQGLGNGGLRHC